MSYDIFQYMESKVHLQKVAQCYSGEEGTESAARREVLNKLEKKLKKSLRRAIRFKNDFALSRNAHVSVEFAKNPGIGGKKVQVIVGTAPERGVKALTSFHNNAIKNQGSQARLNAEVMRIKQWIGLQGASIDSDGKILWPKNNKVVLYDRQLAQDMTRVSFRGGMIYLGDKPFHTAEMATVFSGPGYAIYVMSREGNMHVSSHAVGIRHHSSLLAGDDVIGAGELKVINGRLKMLSNKSGHYCPDAFNLLKVLEMLEDNNVAFDFTVQFHNGKGTMCYASVDSFMNKQQFNDGGLITNQLADLYYDGDDDFEEDDDDEDDEPVAAFSTYAGRGNG